jgi:transposase
MPQEERLVGLDVSSSQVDGFVLASTAARSVENDAAGRTALLAWLRAEGVELAVLEASGGCERSLVRTLRAAGLQVRVVDPRRVRDYARAMGRRAKNDRIDAEMIARFAKACPAKPGEHSEHDPAREAVASLLATRLDLLETRISLQNRLGHQDGPARRVLARVIARLDKEIAGLDRLIARAIADHPPFQALARRLHTVPGVGPVLIAALIAWLPELGRIDRMKLAALVGVAPYDQDSGNSHAPRHIAGGRTALRCVLYMATLGAATQSNPVLKATYQRLCANGKAPKLALVACMRKLLHILNTMVARDEDWQPDTAARLAAPPAA